MKWLPPTKWSAVLDLDGVTYKFIEKFESRFGDDHRDYISLVKRYPEREDEILRWVADPFTYSRLEPMELGVQIARFLMKPEQECAVHIVTSRPASAQENTRKSLRRDEVPYSTLTFRHGGKEDAIRSFRPDFVIDDIISVLESIRPYFGVLSKQPYNETIFFPRIGTFEQFQSIWQKVVDENVPHSLRRVGVAEDLSGHSKTV